VVPHHEEAAQAIQPAAQKRKPHSPPRAKKKASQPAARKKESLTARSARKIVTPVPSETDKSNRHKKARIKRAFL
jgi:hypothetical protein